VSGGLHLSPAEPVERLARRLASSRAPRQGSHPPTHPPTVCVCVCERERERERESEREREREREREAGGDLALAFLHRREQVRVLERDKLLPVARVLQPCQPEPRRR
jgi:hypothetical protein